MLAAFSLVQSHTSRLRLLLLLLLLQILLLSRSPVCAQCPRKLQSESATVDPSNPSYASDVPSSVEPSASVSAPGSRPPERFIQSTFLHNDKSDDDAIFSTQIVDTLVELRQRLSAHRHLTIDNENVDCSQAQHPRCAEYKLRDPFHLIIIEDPSHGAQVYSIKRKFNTNQALIEASLLSAFSQHIDEDLSIYASKMAQKEVGFIRRLSNEEVLALIAKRPKPRQKSITSRSALETNLIELSLLEFRSFAHQEDWSQLIEYSDETLQSAIDSDRLSFVLFWTNVNSISQHTFWLWSKASDRLKSLYEGIKIGAVPCHRRAELCDANGLSKVDHYHTIYVYRNGKRYTSMKDVKNVDYYVEWVKILMSGRAVQLKDENELKEARKGRLESFDGIRPAITIGIFASESSRLFEIFMQVCDILAGRYHFAYYIKKGASNAIYTIRPNEAKKKREDYEDGEDIESLIHFITKSSFPSIMDISNGFTSDILLRQPRPVALLLHSEHDKMLSFAEFCSKKPQHICAHIIRENCKATKDLLQQISLDESATPTPKLIVFREDKIYVSEYRDEEDATQLKEALDAAISSDPIKIITSNDVHPLRYVQLAHINDVFGEQQITLLPDPQIVDTYFHHDMDDLMDDDSMFGGCPVMSQVHRLSQQQQQNPRDEL